MTLEPGSPHPRTGSAGHPVWNVYDELRTARFNTKYYECQLERAQRTNLIVEVALALTASGSALALFLQELPLMASPLGNAVWKALGVVAAALAVLKPLVNWTERIRKIEATIASYRGLELDLRKIQVGIEEAGAYTEELKASFARALDRKKQVVVEEINLRSDPSLRQRCQREVNQQLPVDHFYIPRE